MNVESTVSMEPTVNTAPGLSLNDVSLTLGEHLVFSNLTLNIPAGQWHAVLGRSGIGKSSLIRLLAGIQKADSGTLQSDDGIPLSDRVAYMSQDDGLLPWLSVIDNVQLGPKLRGEKSSKSQTDATALIAKTGLTGWEEALPRDLSGGMRQRVALARTLLEDRPVVLMDEPFSRLDAITRAELQQLAFSLLETKTVVLVTHDPVEALRLAHHIVILQGGVPTQTDYMQPVLTSLPGSVEDPLFAKNLSKLWSLLKSDYSDNSLRQSA